MIFFTVAFGHNIYTGMAYNLGISYRLAKNSDKYPLYLVTDGLSLKNWPDIDKYFDKIIVSPKEYFSYNGQQQIGYIKLKSCWEFSQEIGDSCYIDCDSLFTGVADISKMADFFKTQPYWVKNYGKYRTNEYKSWWDDNCRGCFKNKLVNNRVLKSVQSTVIYCGYPNKVTEDGRKNNNFFKTCVDACAYFIDMGVNNIWYSSVADEAVIEVASNWDNNFCDRNGEILTTIKQPDRKESIYDSFNKTHIVSVPGQRHQIAPSITQMYDKIVKSNSRNIGAKRVHQWIHKDLNRKVKAQKIGRIKSNR